MSLMHFVMYSIITLDMTVGSYSGYCLASGSGKEKKYIVMRQNFHTTAKWVHYSKLCWWGIQKEIDGFIKPELNFSHKQNYANTETAKCYNNYVSDTKEVIRMAAAASHSSLSRFSIDLHFNRRGRQTLVKLQVTQCRRHGLLSKVDERGLALITRGHVR